MKLPKIFRRKNRDEHNISGEMMVDIPVYGPHDNLLPPMYSVSAIMSEFESGFEETCKAFIHNCEMDKFNHDYRDDMIDRHIGEAADMLNLQEMKNIETIDSLTRIRMADLLKGRSRLEQLEKEYLENEEELRRMEAIYNKGTTLEETVPVPRIARREMNNDEVAA